MPQDNTKLKCIPEPVVTQITDAMNALESKEITVNVQKTKLKPDAEFVFLFLDNMNLLINNPAITKQDIAVLLSYARKMMYGNQISISQKDIADELGTFQPNVSASVKKLTQLGVFYKEGRSLFMNWKFLAKGNLTDFMKAEQEKEKLAQELRLANNN